MTRVIDNFGKYAIDFVTILHRLDEGIVLIYDFTEGRTAL
jgi:hypothetical protein